LVEAKVVKNVLRLARVTVEAMLLVVFENQPN